MADTGDGFNSTYSVFSVLARHRLTLANNSLILPRGQSVIVGGNICYPLPRFEHLMRRFLRPVGWALPSSPFHHQVNMFMMPGNHEWFDHLENYRRYILGREEDVGGYFLPVNSRYFTLQLPFDWFVLCVDLGKDDFQDMDQEQVDYFMSFVQGQASNVHARFILVTHEPDWVRTTCTSSRTMRSCSSSGMRCWGPACGLCLAGDLHYYRRMQSETANLQLIVAGHGGAFGHPTFTPSAVPGCRIMGSRFDVACDYPDRETSKKMFEAHWLDGIMHGE